MLPDAVGNVRVRLGAGDASRVAPKMTLSVSAAVTVSVVTVLTFSVMSLLVSELALYVNQLEPSE